MDATVFSEARFWLLVAFSLVIPVGLYVWMLAKRAISHRLTLLFGVTLVGIAGVDVYLLQTLAAQAKLTPSLADDRLFASEVSLGLYLLPALCGGVGINVVSHVLVNHLDRAERRFKQERSE